MLRFSIVEPTLMCCRRHFRWQFCVLVAAFAVAPAHADRPVPDADFVTLPGNLISVFAISSSPTKDLIAAAGYGTVMLWKASTGKELATWRAHEGFANALVFLDGSGLLATGGSDGLVRLWQLPEGREMGCLRGHKDSILALATTPAG